MLFHSLDFAFFLPFCLGIYYLIPSRRFQLRNAFLLAASLVFYGWWDYRYLAFIGASAILDFVVAGQIHRHYASLGLRKMWLAVSVLANIGMLFYFKYANFFIQSFAEAFTLFGSEISVHRLDVVLPVGISFYTFQTMSYTIDVYRGQLKPQTAFIPYAAFVTFFPQLVAGPIERASHLLGQFQEARQATAQDWMEGAKQMLWGFFKKMVIADNCAVLVNTLFDHPQNYGGSSLALGAVFFAFQIYGDFSGYSDIAIGVARLFGFRLKQNFAFPYFSRDIAEFWRRWHISLSTWFRDYLYIPLGGSRGNLYQKIRNTFIVFLVSGFWHGANWTFLIWGCIHAALFLPLLVGEKNRNHLNFSSHLNLNEFFQMLSTFVLVCLAWIFFRAAHVGDAFFMIKKIFSPSFFSLPQVYSLKTLLALIFLLAIEWKGRFGTFALEQHSVSSRSLVRYAFYIGLILAVYFLGQYSSTIEFIYFQF